MPTPHRAALIDKLRVPPLQRQIPALHFFYEWIFMNNKLYVGNLAFSVTSESLQDSFTGFGDVQSAKVMMDRETGRSKGFGFVEMSTDAQAQAAIDGLNGKTMEGRALTVNVARPREERSGGGGGYNNRY